MRKHKPWLAFLLSFILPGTGLLYLGKWKQGIANFVLVHAILFFLVFGVGEPGLLERIHYVFLGLAAASGGYAHGVALTLNKSAKSSGPVAAAS